MNKIKGRELKRLNNKGPNVLNNERNRLKNKGQNIPKVQNLTGSSRESSSTGKPNVLMINELNGKQANKKIKNVTEKHIVFGPSDFYRNAWTPGHTADKKKIGIVVRRDLELYAINILEGLNRNNTGFFYFIESIRLKVEGGSGNLFLVERKRRESQKNRNMMALGRGWLDKSEWGKIETVAIKIGGMSDNEIRIAKNLNLMQNNVIPTVYYIYKNMKVENKENMKVERIPLQTEWPGLDGEPLRAMIMENLEGEDLGDFKKSNGNREISPDMYKKIMQKLLMFYSETGCIHGDLHENNIWVMKTGRNYNINPDIKLIDFGRAHCSDLSKQLKAIRKNYILNSNNGKTYVDIHSLTKVIKSIIKQQFNGAVRRENNSLGKYYQKNEWTTPKINNMERMTDWLKNIPNMQIINNIKKTKKKVWEGVQNEVEIQQRQQLQQLQKNRKRNNRSKFQLTMLHRI